MSGGEECRTKGPAATQRPPASTYAEATCGLEHDHDSGTLSLPVWAPSSAISSNKIARACMVAKPSPLLKDKGH